MFGRNRFLALVLAFVLAGAAIGQTGGWSDGGAWSNGAWTSAAWIRAEPRKDMESFSIAFTTQSLLVNTANPASINDTSLVWGRASLGRGFSGPMTTDFARRLTFAALLADDIDSLHVLGSTRNVVTFAYSQIDTLQPLGVTNSTSDYIHMTSGPRVDLGGGTYGPSTAFNSANRQAIMIYVPWEKYIPPGATITNAYVDFAKAPSAYTPTVADEVRASLISDAGTDKWYAIKGIGVEVDRATVGWRRQQTKGPLGNWTGAATAYPWSPEFKTVTAISPFAGPTQKTNFAANLSSGMGFRVNLTQVVQAVIDGATNNGIMLTTGVSSVNEAGGYQTLLSIYESDEYYNTTARGRGMYFVVEYSIPRTFAEERIIQAVGTVTVVMYGGKIGLKNFYLPEGTTGTLHVKYMNRDTDEQIGTTKTVGPDSVFGYIPMVAVENGTLVEVLYTCDTDTSGWSSLTEWTSAAIVEMQSGDPDVEVWPNIAEPF